MKKICFIILMLFCLVLLLNGCQNDTTMAKEAVANHFKQKNFVAVPLECIEYIGFSNEYDMFEFSVNYNSKEYYADQNIYDNNDKPTVYHEKIYVEKSGKHFIVYTKEEIETK